MRPRTLRQMLVMKQLDGGGADTRAKSANFE